MESMIDLLTNVGFPTTVSIYLLVRFEGKISELSASIRSLEKSIDSLIMSK